MTGDRRPGRRDRQQPAAGWHGRQGWQGAHGRPEPSRPCPHPPPPGHAGGRSGRVDHAEDPRAADAVDGGPPGPPPPAPPLVWTDDDGCACGRVCVCLAPASVVRPVASFVAEWHPAYVATGDGAAEADEDATRCRCGQAFCGYRRLARTLAKNGAFVRA